MFSIGIIGDDCVNQTMEMLLHLYRSKGLKVISKSVGNNESYLEKWVDRAKKEEADILLTAMNYECTEENKVKGIKFNILIYLSGGSRREGKAKKLPNFLEEKNVVIVNSDNKGFFPFSIGTGTTLITCGFNSKASVTASSVVCDDDNTEKIQCCIQRAIRTISGERLEPQEFAVNLDNKRKNVIGALAAITAAIAYDMEISELDLNL